MKKKVQYSLIILLAVVLVAAFLIGSNKPISGQFFWGTTCDKGIIGGCSSITDCKKMCEDLKTTPFPVGGSEEDIKKWQEKIDKYLKGYYLYTGPDYAECVESKGKEACAGVPGFSYTYHPCTNCNVPGGLLQQCYDKDRDGVGKYEGAFVENCVGQEIFSEYIKKSGFLGTGLFGGEEERIYPEENPKLYKGPDCAPDDYYKWVWKRLYPDLDNDGWFAKFEKRKVKCVGDSWNIPGGYYAPEEIEAHVEEVLGPFNGIIIQETTGQTELDFMVSQVLVREDFVDDDPTKNPGIKEKCNGEDDNSDEVIDREVIISEDGTKQELYLAKVDEEGSILLCIDKEWKEPNRQLSLQQYAFVVIEGESKFLRVEGTIQNVFLGTVTIFKDAKEVCEIGTDYGLGIAQVNIAITKNKWPDLEIYRNIELNENLGIGFKITVLGIGPKIKLKPLTPVLFAYECVCSAGEKLCELVGL